MPAESPRWTVPVRLPNHRPAELVFYAVNGDVVMLPPTMEGACIIPASSEGPLKEAIREAFQFNVRQALRRSGC